MLPLMGLKLRRQEVKMITSRKQKGYTYRSRRTNEDHILIQSFPYVHVLEEGLRIFFNVRYEPTVSLTQSLTGSAYERQVSYHTAVPDASSGPKKACMPILRRFSRTTRGDFSHSCEYCMVCWSSQQKSCLETYGVW